MCEMSGRRSKAPILLADKTSRRKFPDLVDREDSLLENLYGARNLSPYGMACLAAILKLNTELVWAASKTRHQPGAWRGRQSGAAGAY